MTRTASVLGLTTIVFAACSANPNALGVTDTGTITGTLQDARTHAPIQQAVVAVGTAAVRLSPPDNGTFTLRVPTGTQTVNITAAGYNSQSIPVVVRKDQSSCITEGCVPYGLQPVSGL